VFIGALLGAIGISATIMSPVGLPFIVVASILLASIIGAFGPGIGRFCVDTNSLEPLTLPWYGDEYRWRGEVLKDLKYINVPQG
jgi:hypothetical protein